ncbi:hypothetical protein PSQ19_17005 [Devosia algicola]|uniref:Uncharacterized protein n=1 Tax=Devosia algicola TaxID=3026418 RepID=A0ABY7YM79_9HYPH|nr:hypothetical protein [Devosia algicola]WDR02307.1 hypothetical protein PSQ19_17005 [Devosia algicola]
MRAILPGMVSTFLLIWAPGAVAAEAIVGTNDLAGLSPQAPFGVKIGMRGREAVTLLEVAGLAAVPGSAPHYARMVSGADIDVILGMGRFQAGSLDEPVSQIDYRWSGPLVDLSAPAIVEDLAMQFGVESKCDLSGPDVAYCQWRAPPNAPLVHAITLTISSNSTESNVTLNLMAVTDLEERLASSSSGFSVDSGQFDPIAPEGAMIGQRFAELRAILNDAGYVSGSDCEGFYKDSQTRWFSLELGGCADDTILGGITFHVQHTQIDGSIRGLVERITAASGATPDCETANDDAAACLWTRPSSLPQLSQIYLAVSRSGLDLHIEATPNFMDHLAVMSETPKESHWWEAELAAAAADVNTSLLAVASAAANSDIRDQAFAEGRYAYQYCQDRGIYAESQRLSVRGLKAHRVTNCGPRCGRGAAFGS